MAPGPTLASRLARAIARRPGPVVALSCLLTAAALLPASRLRIDTDLADLLPTGAPAAEDYRVFLDTFGGFEKVFVVIRAPSGGAEPAALAEAGERLAAALAGSPEVAHARAGLEAADERFFLDRIAPRMPLLLPDAARAGLARRLEPAAIRGRVAELRRALRGPAGGFAAPLYAADPLGLTEGLLAAAPAGLPLDPVTGAFLSPAGDAALVLLTPSRAEIDPAAGRALLAALDRAYARVRRETGAALDFRAVGGPIYAAHDEAILHRDLASTLSWSTLGVGLALLAGFEGVAIPAAITAAVVAGVVWTVALAALALGRVTVVGVGFAAALLGMGVEYGIHGGARYRHARLGGEDRAAALATAFREAGPGIVSSALTTAVAVGALALAHFRPLRELGTMLTIGVLATLVTTATLGAALLVRRRRAPERAPRSFLWRSFWVPLMDGVVGFARRRPRAVLAGALAATALSLWGLSALEVSVDPRALRPRDNPLARVERLVAEQFGIGLDTSTVVVRRRSLGEALDAAARVRDLLARRLGPEAAIDAPSDWIVLGSRRERRLRELRALPFGSAAADLERELRAAGFRLEPFAPALAALRGFARGEDPGAPPAAEWPDWMSELVRTGPEGAAVAVHVRLPLGQAARVPAEALARELRRAVPGAALASTPRVGRELRALAVRDLSRSSAVAALLVAGVVLVSLRGRVRASLLASLPLVLGCLWTFGLWGALERPIDLVCIAALPVLLGTGIDLGVHALHGARLHPRGLAGTVEEAGPAMTLVMLTTGLGFGSLLASRVPGLQNAGLIVAIGVNACLVATLLVLPAIEALAGPAAPDALEWDEPREDEGEKWAAAVARMTAGREYR